VPREPGGREDQAALARVSYIDPEPQAVFLCTWVYVSEDSEEDGEFFSRARASAWQVDGFEATFGPPAEVPPVKGGHYSKLDATKAALRKAYERLAEQVGAR